MTVNGKKSVEYITKHSSKPITNDIKERLSEPGSVPCDNDFLIIDCGCSGFETLTDLVNPNGLGNLTAMLQVQGGGVLMYLMLILPLLLLIVITVLLILH